MLDRIIQRRVELVTQASLNSDISNCNIGYRIALAETPSDQRPHKAYRSISRVAFIGAFGARW
jgi:hypothetical protein